ncbi:MULTISPECIES: oligopeptide ABC transporter substrate-binding protein [Bacillus]|uniref:ABC transporter substrate-binding protein n=2 Tax=Bacillus TaxID=1386 RepID=A0A0M3R8V8_9BACI|nr:MULTISPECIES: oligopeptide ABC transporter substrate-binding protein [Bacillus]ALC80356.1 ABC transporter substrate-binding protein [Bacillus gobiensis]MBP1083799.1 peptide/nickel transport system substrate-binding protein [Bacillus capparidis]MED1098284.1 oligopeptide ABC transporter substrate-binding protein [Bacillus capparidis]
MKKLYQSKLLLVLLAAFMLLVTACNNEEGSTAEKEGKKDDLLSIDDFASAKKADGEIIDGGTLTYGLVSDTPFEGTLNFNFYQGTYDDEVISWFDESILDADENYMYTQDGAATFEVSEDKKTFTFTIRDNVNWHDGKPVTAEDWAFAFEVLGDPDYPGTRFAEASNVQGFEDYRSGKADSISGLKIIDDKTLQITFVEANPSLLASGIWTHPLPKHIFGDMKVADMESSPEIREHPIGFGPFKVDSIVPGESVVYKKNEDYWRGEPKLDEVILKVVNPSVVTKSLQDGDVDIAVYPTDQYKDNVKALSNVDFLGKIDLAYTYIGFKLGKWQDNKNVMDPNMKMSDVNLRKAMAHAVNNQDVGEQFYDGLRWAGTTVIPPSHPAFHDDSNPGLEYDPEQSKKILDENGYKDTNGDGLREDKNGNELVINFASMSGGDIAEPLANYYIQKWKEVGLNVKLVDGRLLEFNSFYDRLEADDKAIDIFQGAWGVGSDVDPTGLWGSAAAFNYTRWTNEESDQLLAEGISEKAFDEQYRSEVYEKWQKLMTEEIPAFPTLYRSELTAVNKRVANWDVKPGTKLFNDRSQLGVTAEKPEVAGQ